MATLGSLRAEILSLKDGGTVEGQILNPRDVPRSVYEVRTDSGIVVSVSVRLLERSPQRVREGLVEYERIAPLRDDSLATHRELAMWCTDRQLGEQKIAHWNRIIQLDPENAEARLHLGHQKIDGLWTTREEQNIARGYIRYDGAWKTRQEIEIAERDNQTKAATEQWKKQLERMRAALSSNAAMRERITSITDPYALSALAEKLAQDESADARILYIRALSNIGTPAAVHLIAGWAVEGQERTPDVRLICFEEIRKHPEAIPGIGKYYASCLDPVRCDNALINRAAFGIGEIGARGMVPELVEALVTAHKWEREVQNQGNVSRGSGGSGLTWGTSKVSGVDHVKNQEVRRALFKLTGQDFEYDKDLWRQWLVRIRKTPTFDARRG